MVRCRPDDVYLSRDALVVQVCFVESGRFRGPCNSTCLWAVLISTRLVVLLGNEFSPSSPETLQEIASVGGVDVRVQQGGIPLKIPNFLVIKLSSIRNKIKYNRVETLPSS